MQLCSDERGFISVLKRRGIIDQENKFIFKPDEQTVFIQSSYFELIFEAMTHQFQLKFHSEQKKIRTMSSIPPPQTVGKQQSRLLWGSNNFLWCSIIQCMPWYWQQQCQCEWRQLFDCPLCRGPIPFGHSGGVTPVSGRATPSHFFPLCDEEGAEFIKQLQSMSHRLTSGEFHLSDLDLSKYFSSDQAPSMDGINITQSVTTPVVAASGSFGSTDSESCSGSSSAYSFSKSSLSSLTKSASVSPRNAKYLGVQMGHEDFVGQHFKAIDLKLRHPWSQTRRNFHQKDQRSILPERISRKLAQTTANNLYSHQY